MSKCKHDRKQLVIYIQPDKQWTYFECIDCEKEFTVKFLVKVYRYRKGIVQTYIKPQTHE